MAKARCENSPPVAIRQPQSMSRFTICCCIHTEPWHDISITSSPVNELGVRNNVSTTSSSTSPSAKSILPRCAVWEVMVLSCAPFQQAAVHSMARGPLTLITAIPPVPCGVAMAQIVSRCIVLSIAIKNQFISKCFAKLQNCVGNGKNMRRRGVFRGE